MDFVHVMIIVMVIVVKSMIIAHWLYNQPVNWDEITLPNGNHKPKELRTMVRSRDWQERAQETASNAANLNVMEEAPPRLRKVILNELLEEDAIIISIDENSVEWRDPQDNHWMLKIATL